jgi:integral membrane protein (TIGR01906 family)
VQRMITAWYILGAVLIGLGLGAWAGKWSPEFWQAFARGGWLTIGLVLAVLLGVALSFSALFVGFHRIFFTGDTWLFEYSDSLIRLFPMRFWQDAFISMSALALIQGLLAGRLGGKLSGRNK